MKQYGDRRVYSVRGVVTAVWRRFQDLPSFWMEGEITNLSAARGSQVFFTLVDTDHSDPTQIDCSMQANVFAKMEQPPTEGALVQAYGRIEFWRGRSTVRVRVERLEPAGEGLLLARIAALRARLNAEGLTDPARKRPLPFLPRCVGLITARDGAARADVIANVTKRFPGMGMLVVTSLVQGDGAPAQIARALRYLDAQAHVDVIVLARGGGALEDLMAFNSEIVCRAVAASATPVVSAIGHESDRTLCDEVADARASTPTKAAELVVPDAAELAERVAGLARRSVGGLTRIAVRATRDMTALTRRMGMGLRAIGAAAGHRVALLDARRVPALARARDNGMQALAREVASLGRAMDGRMAGADQRLGRAAEILELLSPQRTVERGYAIVRDRDGRVVGQVSHVQRGQQLAVELRDGSLQVDVSGVKVKEQE